MEKQTKQVDLSTLSASELRKELERRESAQKGLRSTYKGLVNDLVPGMVDELLAISKGLSEAKANIFNSFRDIIKMKAEAYGVVEEQQSHTFTSTDGKSIQIGFRIVDGWDDSYTAGITKVNTYLESLAKDDDSRYLVNGIFKLLKKDDKGNLKQSRIIELQEMANESGNEEFIDGVRIILDAYKPQQSSWFIEAYYNDNGIKKTIPLALSTVPFPADFKFDFFKPNNQ
ncbi:MAG: hypothetical protein BGO87_12825 [Flavobacteriia bacterium 40-80]|nr:MAG: hypothetical protein BGO87_12825 [Flavobacteriia bacterium 40-80]